MSVSRSASKEGVRFASEGEAANGSVLLLRQAEGATISGGKITAGLEEETKDDKDGDGDEAEASTSSKKVKVEFTHIDDEEAEDIEDEDGSGKGGTYR